MNTTTAIIGHRGWPARFPGNTLAGFIGASGVADALELDVRRSGDGKLVLSHDPDLAGHEVASHPWSFLGGLDLGQGHRPALLDEVLSSLPTVPCQIEIKNDPWQPGFEPDHRLALEAAERARDIDVITSYNWASVALVRRIFPDVVTGIILGRQHDLHGAVEHCREFGHSVLVPEHQLIDSPITDVVEGLQVTVWVVNDIETAGKLVDWGVSGLITDDPPSLASLRDKEEHRIDDDRM